MFVRFSNKKIQNQKIVLDNVFITDYLPYAPEMCVKVYLLGLSLASGNPDNSLEMIADTLSINTDEVLSAFKYWENQGLITMISITPPLVEYKEVERAEKRIKTFSKTKYKAFNEQLHAMLPRRSFLPAEYNEYYNSIESLHIEPEAMLAIIAYCVRLKGDKIGYPYILTVARNLASEGYTTYERINERLSEFDLYDGEIKAIIKALGSRRKPDVGDKRYYIKWTKTLGFLPETIIKVAKTITKGGIERLNSMLTRYFENHALSYEEIQKYEKDRGKLFSLTAEILRVLGKYYERLDYIIENYTQKWLGYGFTDDALITIADYCFRKNIRDMEAMDSIINEFYQKGLLTKEDIQGYKEQLQGADNTIKKILSAADIVRNISSWDRDYYRTWTFSWKFDLPTIKYAATLSKGKGVAYINGILANWHQKGIASLDDAKKAGGSTQPAQSLVTDKNADELLEGLKTLDLEDIV